MINPLHWVWNRILERYLSVTQDEIDALVAEAFKQLEERRRRFD